MKQIFNFNRECFKMKKKLVKVLKCNQIKTY